jgi:hypothetical protein
MPDNGFVRALSGERRAAEAGIGHDHDRLLVAKSGFENRRGFGGACRGDGFDFMGLHD